MYNASTYTKYDLNGWLHASQNNLNKKNLEQDFIRNKIINYDKKERRIR